MIEQFDDGRDLANFYFQKGGNLFCV